MQYEPKINGYEVVGMFFIMGTNSFCCYFFIQPILNHFFKKKPIKTGSFRRNLLKSLTNKNLIGKKSWPIVYYK